jgi:DNA adenine methylase
MKYMGSKNRHAKEILPLMLAGRGDSWERAWVEPFVGGCNMIDKVHGFRIANDTHPHLIALWKAVERGWEPPSVVSEEQYTQARLLSKTVEADSLIGFIGFGCSYSGKWFGGYARGNDAEGNPRNYAAESARNILKQAAGIHGVNFHCGDYRATPIPDRSTVYCDPPYMGTTGYKGDIDHAEFWSWCDDLHNAGHRVFVSEYAAPEGWECIWSKTVHNTLVQDTGSKEGTERLFAKA